MVGVLLFLLICIALPFAMPTILTGLALIAAGFYFVATRAGFAIGWLWGLAEPFVKFFIYCVFIWTLLAFVALFVIEVVR